LSFPARKFGRGRKRHIRGEMNSLERAYAEYLDDQDAVDSWKFEDVTLTIIHPQTAKITRYTPDFAVYTTDMELEFHECKGWMEADAALKLKAASERYPHRFVLVKRKAKKDGGGWEFTEV
jgi:hypothetical protein